MLYLTGTTNPAPLVIFVTLLKRHLTSRDFYLRHGWSRLQTSVERPLAKAFKLSSDTFRSLRSIDPTYVLWRPEAAASCS